MRFSQDEYKILLANPANVYLKVKTEDERYNDFSGTDPFPRVPNALLNSIDIVKYILTTGMIEPFIPENLAGATYTCDFSGKFLYWDDDKIQQKNTCNDEEELILKPNSITFLEIATTFRIPLYIVLRFNLQVRNVYKGLLLGTGPIVDPGFVGKLFIPLHNLTSNEYIIKKGAHLIDIEFTKLGKRKEWIENGNTKKMKMVKELDFSNVPFTHEIKEKANREIDVYISKALQDKSSNFYKKDVQAVYVNSSMQALKKETNDAIQQMYRIKDDVKESFDKVEKRESFFRNLFITSIVGIFISVASLFVTAGWYFAKATELSKATQLIIQQQEKYEQDKSSLWQVIDETKEIIINQQETDFNAFNSWTQAIIKELEERIHLLENKEP